MKLLVPKASDVIIKKRPYNYTPSFESLVEDFLNGPVTLALSDTYQTSIEIPVPSFAYIDLLKFHKLCKIAMEPLGYVVYFMQGDNGEGLDVILVVEWEAQE